MDLSISAETAYQAAGDVNVTNHFTRQSERGGHRSKTLAWMRAAGDVSDSSVIMLSNDMQVMYCNNRFRTFYKTPPDLRSIVKQMRRKYADWWQLTDAIERSKMHNKPCFFQLHVLQGGNLLHCSCTSITDDRQRQLGFYIVVSQVAHGYSSEIFREGECQRGK